MLLSPSIAKTFEEGKSNDTKRTMEIAREVIDEVAPDEAGLFDQIWDEALQNPALLRAEVGR